MLRTLPRVLHDLRHRRVTTWLAAGGDAVKVKEAMGHADLRTTMGYTHLVRDNLRGLVDESPVDHRLTAKSQAIASPSDATPSAARRF